MLRQFLVGAGVSACNIMIHALVMAAVIPAKHWQLLGPMTAINGVLMFGWSTAVIFEVLRRTMMRISRIAAVG